MGTGEGWRHGQQQEGTWPRQTNIGKHMAGTRKHEDKTREQTCDNTRETNSEITDGQNTDLTIITHSHKY